MKKQKTKAQKEYELQNQGNPIGKQPSELSSKVKDEQIDRLNDRLPQKPSHKELTDEQNETNTVNDQQHPTLTKEELLERRRLKEKGMYAKLTEEKKEKIRANRRRRWALITAEAREKRRAKNRRKYANMSKDEKEKRIVLSRHYRGLDTEEKRLSRNARQREYRKRLKASGKLRKEDNLTEEQRELKKIYQRQHKAKIKAPPVEEKEKRDTYTREYNKKRKYRLECKNALRQQCMVKLVRLEIDNNSKFTNRCMKPSDIVDERCEIIGTVNAEERITQIRKLDYFEECKGRIDHNKTEQLEKKRAKSKEVYAKMTNEQKVKNRANRRHYKPMIKMSTNKETDMRSSNKRKYNKKRLVSDNTKKQRLECENALRRQCIVKLVRLQIDNGSNFKNIIHQQCPVKLAHGETDNENNFTSECLKSSHIVDHQCKTSATVNAELFAPQFGELDYFEESEDWITRIKTECNFEE